MRRRHPDHRPRVVVRVLRRARLEARRDRARVVELRPRRVDRSRSGYPPSTAVLDACGFSMKFATNASVEEALLGGARDRRRERAGGSSSRSKPRRLSARRRSRKSRHGRSGERGTACRAPASTVGERRSALRRERVERLRRRVAGPGEDGDQEENGPRRRRGRSLARAAAVDAADDERRFEGDRLAAGAPPSRRRPRSRRTPTGPRSRRSWTPCGRPRRSGGPTGSPAPTAAPCGPSRRSPPVTARRRTARSPPRRWSSTSRRSSPSGPARRASPCAPTAMSCTSPRPPAADFPRDPARACAPRGCTRFTGSREGQ